MIGGKTLFFVIGQFCTPASIQLLYNPILDTDFQRNTMSFGWL